MSMQTLTLLLSAFAMGLAGGPHCVAMCGAMCAGLASTDSPRRVLWFHGGRMLGYALLGAVAAASVQGLAWGAQHVQALRPAWVLAHALALGWGLVLLISARQPAFASRAAQRVWGFARRAGAGKRHAAGLGLLWAAMPCGLLYSALLLAGLSAGALQGAAVMFAFALGTSITLVLAPSIWAQLRRWREGLGQRVAGLLLVFASAWALNMDLGEQCRVFC
jgi:uncharacterized protein